ALLRFALFHTSADLPAKNPYFYAFDADELWIYRYLFSSTKRWAITPEASDASAETGIEFYRKWSTSLEPDAELGWVRRRNVRIPCHETTNLGTRGTRDYAPETPKLLLFGDSFVESAACSNDTLATKIEKLTSIDTLNYGVGGYGLDQIYLYVKRVVTALPSGQEHVLIGLIQDDLERVLLKIRDGPKPYFTIADHRLVAHTEHIHAGSLNDVFVRPPARFYLYYFLRGKLGYPYYSEVLERTRAERREAVLALATLMARDLADLARRRGFGLAFFLLPTPGASFDSELATRLRAQGVPVLDLQGCFAGSGRPDTELYAELHPTSVGNDFLAACLVRGLRLAGMLRAD
ncbi:MAG TPA: hypothetical protein VFJ48_08975, partial [Casimicrobiaceae bacterium]|nr:hypothetical protein [Casimicrobiaceae bacterium]